VLKIQLNALKRHLCKCWLQYVDRFPLPHTIETTSIKANRAPTGDLVVTAAINDSSEDEEEDTENS